LLYAAQELSKVKVKGDDQKAGVELVRKALEAPIRQITKNAGVDGSVVVGKLLEQNKKHMAMMLKMKSIAICLQKGSLTQLRL
jgi:chaperonin GroEL (HSP60 family)